VKIDSEAEMREVMASSGLVEFRVNKNIVTAYKISFLRKIAEAIITMDCKSIYQSIS
jgi:hypothetical protein